MGLYHVKFTNLAGKTLQDGKNAAIVQADSVADAKQIMKAYVGTPKDGAWSEATVTLLSEATNLVGWRTRITIKDTGGSVVEQVTVTSVDTDDFDDIGGDLVTALNATTSIAGAAYSTPNLTIAETTDGLGDHTVVCELLPPTTWDDPNIVLSGLFGTLTHEGASGAALSVVLNNIKTPQVKYQVRD